MSGVGSEWEKNVKHKIIVVGKMNACAHLPNASLNGKYLTIFSIFPSQLFAFVATGWLDDMEHGLQP